MGKAEWVYIRLAYTIRGSQEAEARQRPTKVIAGFLLTDAQNMDIFLPTQEIWILKGTNKYCAGAGQALSLGLEMHPVTSVCDTVLFKSAWVVSSSDCLFVLSRSTFDTPRCLSFVC